MRWNLVYTLRESDPLFEKIFSLGIIQSKIRWEAFLTLIGATWGDDHLLLKN